MEEIGIGNVVNEFDAFQKKKKNEITFKNIPSFVDEIFKLKDKTELENMKISSLYSCMLMAYMVQKFENIIDDEKIISHSQIIDEIKKRITKPDFTKKFVDKNSSYSIDVSNLEVGNLNIQSGGYYHLNGFSENDSNKLKNDVIICKVLSYYKSYDSVLIRTFMIDADKTQQKYYKILHEAFIKLISKMTPGTKIKDIYTNIKNIIIESDSSLINKIPSNFGCGIGVKNDENLLNISEENESIIEEGMTFQIILSLSDLEKDGKKYSIQIGDSVLITKDNPKVLTESSPKTLTDIYYNYDDEDENDEKQKMIESLNENPFKRVTRQMDKKKNNIDTISSSKKRQEHQLELLEQKNEEFRKKILNKDADLNLSVAQDKIDLSHIKCYEKKSQIPLEVFNNFGKIFIDKKNSTIILPILKSMVPFHISLIKNATKNEDGNFTVLRINFLVPVSGVTFGQINVTNPIFIRYISYKNKDANLINNILLEIKDLAKNYKLKKQEMKEKADLVSQEHIIPNKGKRIYLNEVKMKPVISGKKTIGLVEAHTNGLRFTSLKNEKIEIIYNNIKHAFIQPCKTDIIVLIHFHLKNPIMVGKKKAIDIQFYKDIGIQADDLDLRRRGNDYDEFENERKERLMKEKIYEDFMKFAKSIEDMKTIEFDYPYTNLEFSGVLFRSNVPISPTKYCLVALTEQPFFVFSISDINLVYFERVTDGVKNFDMTIVFKDLSKPVQMITTIELEHLETIKTWLDENDILFGEGTHNLNWDKIIANIKDNPKEFIENGGWDFTQENANEEEDEESANDGDDNYDVESDEEDYSDDDDDDFEEEEEEESLNGDDELSDKGLSWDELERNARDDDKEHARKHREEEEERKIKKKGKR